MWAIIKCIYMLLLLLTLLAFPLLLEAHRLYRFVVREAAYTRLCVEKNILTVNGEFPGPTIRVFQGETILVDVYNYGDHNITIHWHGVKQPRNPWSDGPVYITQCPIQPGGRFLQKVIFSDEVGTAWWHGHSDWARATVHGAIVVYPKPGAYYPFPTPDQDVPIILGEWWKEDVFEVLTDFLRSGGQPRDSDAYMINGQPGDLYPCSRQDTFKLRVTYGSTVLLRFVNADMNEILFVGVANHTLTIVGTDGSYTKPLTVPYIAISPGQTINCLLHANNAAQQRYYIAARPYVNGIGILFNNSTTTAIVEYAGANYTGPSASPPLPSLPYYNDTPAATNFSNSLRSLNSESHPAKVPLVITTRILTTISLNAFPCPSSSPNETCQGPNRTRLAASMNNITFVNPSIDVLDAYYFGINGVYGTNFPRYPPLVYNYTSDNYTRELEISRRGTKVKVLRYGSSVEIVLQGTNLISGFDHPMHLHGFNFYVVGSGFGNFDEIRDPMSYNLVDPPLRNTVQVPISGWTAIRFKANNPGVWFMHCHLERHLTWGMNTVFIVENGKLPAEWLLPRPPYMPPC